METSVHITQFIEPNLKPISCILKYRFTDFHVTEILPSKELIEMTSPLPNEPILNENLSEQNEPMAGNDDDDSIRTVDSVNAMDSTNSIESKEDSLVSNVDKLEPNNSDPNAVVLPNESPDNVEIPVSIDQGDTATEILKEVQDWKSLEPWKDLLQVDNDNKELLESFVTSIYSLLYLNKDSKLPNLVESYPISSKKIRSDIHKLLKHEAIKDSGFTLASAFVHSTESVHVSRKRIAKKQPTTYTFKENSQFLQFYLFKKNKSTMEAVSQLAYYLK